jgi:hypothetical protein
LSLDQEAVPHFSWNNGLLRYKKRIWVGSDLEIQLQLIAAVHDSAIGGHSGFPVTYGRMKQLFAWTDMRTVLQDYVQSCMTCQQAKPDRAKSPGLLQPVAIPDAAWQIVSMDFVEGLPQSGHANRILVVIDKFTKYGHFQPLKHPIQQLQWLSCFWMKYTGCMVCLFLSFQTGIKYLPPNSGRSCLICPKCSWL